MDNTTKKKVTVIPATKSLHPDRDGITPTRDKIRVAAYCRVSTSLEEQQGSYALQCKYYEAMITSNPAWELAGIYGDEGKSGTSLKGRTGFLQMMDDVRAGKIDYIVTKATSRFGRNNSEFIEILDELESYGVEVLFESEGIMTSGRQNRTMLQIIGVTNEHYSSSLSNNVRWSKERNMRKGKVTICYKNFLGYEKGEDGNPKIVEEEAKTVRLIYDLFLTGKPYKYIAEYLEEQGIPTPTGSGKWTGARIKSILTNEKYTGDALLQKTFKRNYLDKHVHKNTGEKTQVLVENNHPAIIDKATFARVQELVKKRADRRNSGTATSPFVGRIICAECGDYYGHRTWHSRGHIKYDMWVCNSKYTEQTTYSNDKCKVANLRQEWIEQGYIHTMNQLLAVRSQILGKYRQKLKRIESRLTSGNIEKELKALEDKTNKVEEQIALLKSKSEFTFGDHTVYSKRMNELKAQGQEIIQKKLSLEEERTTLAANKQVLQSFICSMEAMPEKLKKFSGKDFINTIDRVEAGLSTLTYHFYGGEHIKVDISSLKKMCF